ncbi:3'-5' exonuclease [Saitoella coloradoensis]
MPVAEKTKKVGGNWKALQKTIAPSKSSKPYDRLNAKKTLATEDDKKASLLAFAEDNDISPEDLAKAYGAEAVSKKSKASTLTSSKNTKIGRYVAIDCEMVGVGPDGTQSTLARVSMVNFHGNEVLDLFVLPKEKVTDYRTFVSGITPAMLKAENGALPFESVQQRVADILQDRILIGHAVHHDLAALLLKHPRSRIRDTSLYPPYRQLSKGKTPSLKRLSKELLGIEIQNVESNDSGRGHSSVEDAKATMSLYRREKEGFEKEFGGLKGARKAKE